MDPGIQLHNIISYAGTVELLRERGVVHIFKLTVVDVRKWMVTRLALLDKF